MSNISLIFHCCVILLFYAILDVVTHFCSANKVFVGAALSVNTHIFYIFFGADVMS